MTKDTMNTSENKKSENRNKLKEKEEKNDVELTNNIEIRKPSKLSKELMKTPAILKYKAYERIIGYAMRYASDEMDENDWREVYGILIGSIEDGKTVVIKDAIPMVVGNRAGVTYENKQYVDMAQIDESVYERSIRDEKNDFIIGWWHTHPGFPFRFSDIDHRTQLGYQIPNPYAIGLIFNHCKLRSRDFNLGLAALRLLDPQRGTWSPVGYIELKVDKEHEDILNEGFRVIEDIKKNMPRILKAIDYIDKGILKKRLAFLQRNYGLILIAKDDTFIAKNEAGFGDDEKFLYEWDPELFKESFKIPKFRERIEQKIKKIEGILRDLLEKGDIKKFEKKRNKYSKHIKRILSKPNELYAKIMKEFSEKIGKIYPYYDFLDTNERKTLEHFEIKSYEYNKVLEALNIKACFELDKNN
jgi:proteasome lid subunit RPN8/RPN11